MALEPGNVFVRGQGGCPVHVYLKKNENSSSAATGYLMDCNDSTKPIATEWLQKFNASETVLKVRDQYWKLFFESGSPSHFKAFAIDRPSWL